MPEKASPAIYEFARAAAPDHADEAAFEKLFEQYHGHDPDGLRQLKELAAKSPLPPTGFKLQSVAEIAAEKALNLRRVIRNWRYDENQGRPHCRRW